MSTRAAKSDFTLEPMDNRRLANLCGQFDQNLRQVEQVLNVEINNRGNAFRVIGNPRSVRSAVGLLQTMYSQARDEHFTPDRVHLFLQDVKNDSMTSDVKEKEFMIHTRRGGVRPRGENQRRYLQRILKYDINFGIGPAGTGKTYLAVACAVDALEQQRVERIILTRPAVEAGERLGFLPGDLGQKIDPYLRPLYDALYEMLGFERVAKLMERNAIEIAPLAYMRGRTLNEAFIILDEAQNTTTEQMKMFLTRVGFGSVAVVTGDVTQVDLPSNRQSGLRHAIDVIKGVEGISFTFFKSDDVVRHPLVQKIIEAYDARESIDAGDHS